MGTNIIKCVTDSVKLVKDLVDLIILIKNKAEIKEIMTKVTTIIAEIPKMIADCFGKAELAEIENLEFI